MGFSGGWVVSQIQDLRSGPQKAQKRDTEITELSPQRTRRFATEDTEGLRKGPEGRKGLLRAQLGITKTAPCSLCALWQKLIASGELCSFTSEAGDAGGDPGALFGSQERPEGHCGVDR